MNYSILNRICPLHTCTQSSACSSKNFFMSFNNSFLISSGTIWLPLGATSFKLEISQMFRAHSLYCSPVKCVYLYKVLDSDLVQPPVLHHVLARHPHLVLPAALLQPLHQLQQSMENLYLIHIYSATAPSS